MARVLPFAVPAATFAALAAFARYDNPNRVGGLGLITVIPLPILVAAVALSASFGLLLYRSTKTALPSKLVNYALAAHVAALLFVAHGLSGMLEAQPRFVTSWLHAGFVDALTRTHHPLAHVDARFSWPGFFAGVSAFDGAAGLSSALPLLRFSPLAFEASYLLPVALIARTLVPTATGRWMVIWLFCLGNWVGQDYFSPQAFAYLLMLTILALVCAGLAHPGFIGSGARRRQVKLVGRLLARWPARTIAAAVRADTEALTVAPMAPAMGVILVAVVSFGAMVTAHQFTPVVLTIDLAALVVARRCTARLLPLAFFALVLGWISYAAVDFWSGHLSTLLGGGSVSSTVSQNVGGRIRGSTAHLVVVEVRILVGLTLWLLATVGAIRAIRSGRRIGLATCLLAAVPFPILVAQAYGGEAQLRLYLYTLPFMAALAVRTFVPTAHFGRLAAAAFTVLAMVATPAFYIARFGNEQFEQVRTGEVQAVRGLYAVAPPGATLVSVSSNFFWRYKAIAGYDYKTATLTPSLPLSERSVLELMGKNPLGSYLVVTQGQLAAEVSAGLPPEVGNRLIGLIDSSGKFQLLFANADARVYRFLPGSGRA